MIKYRNIIVNITIALLLVCSVFGGCSYLNNQLGLEDDNAIEEAIEDVIENRTGIDIDLTP